MKIFKIYIIKERIMLIGFINLFFLLTSAFSKSEGNSEGIGRIETKSKINIVAVITNKADSTIIEDSSDSDSVITNINSLIKIAKEIFSKESKTNNSDKVKSSERNENNSKNKKHSKVKKKENSESKESSKKQNSNDGSKDSKHDTKTEKRNDVKNNPNHDKTDKSKSTDKKKKKNK